jgi:Fe-S cluster assembly ATP-binding protein
MMMGVLEVKGLSLNLDGKSILNRLNIDFWEGHVHAVVGPNGAGKSTLASTIMGLSGYRDFEGDIIFKGESIKALDVNERAKRSITMAWQEPARFEGLTIRDFIRSSAKDKSVDNIKKTLEEVGLDGDEYLMRAVDKTLSGGERKKVELASILAMEPEVALLDEPDSGIDIESIERIFEAVKVLKSKGTTVVMITHSLAVLNQAEHAFLMCNGTIVDKGVTDKIRNYFEDKCIPCPHKNIPRAAETGGRV